MDNQQGNKKTKSWMKILIWLGFLIFFVYSYKSIVDLGQILDPRRHESFIRVITTLFKPNLSDSELNHLVARQMWETMQVAFLATSISTVLAIPMTFLSVRVSSPWGSIFNVILQPLFAVIRSVHPVITIFPAIVLVGIGPAASVLSLALFSTAVLIGKFTEYVQHHPTLTRTDLVKLYFPGLALKYFPTNALTATVIGFVGGGGVGSLIKQEILLLNYRDASVAILACIVSIGSLDLITRAVWHKIQFSEKLPPRISEKKELSS